MTSPSIEYQINPRFVPDDIPVWLGNAKDSALIFDNANDEWTVQTRNAAGTLTDRLRIKANTDTPSPDLVNNPLKWTAGRAVTATDYSIGRDLDATNQLHANVPTGATFELSVNDTPEFVFSATQLDLKGNNLADVGVLTITGATGNTLVVDTNTLVVDATNDEVLFGATTAIGNSRVEFFGVSAGLARLVRLINTQAAAAGVGALIEFNGNGTDGNGTVMGGINTAWVGTGSNLGSYMSFSTRISDAGSNTEKLRITAGGSIGIGTTDQFGGGVKVVGLANATTVPASNPTGGGVLYAEAGALKWRGSSGTITTIALA